MRKDNFVVFFELSGLVQQAATTSTPDLSIGHSFRHERR